MASVRPTTSIGRALAVVGLVVALGASSVHASSRQQGKPAYVLGVSSMLVGNGWNEEMICSIKAQARASGKVSRVIVANRRGGPSDQGADLSNLIAADVDAIIVNPTSPDALNGIIKEAAARGVRIITVDQAVTAPEAYAATNDQVAYGRVGAEWLFKQLRGKGNVVELRGIAGVRVDTDRHTGFMQALKRYPGIKVVKQAFTGWSFSSSGQQMADILASGVQVDGVWTSGTDYTVVNAFRAAGKPLVPIVGSDTNEFLRQQRQHRDVRLAAVTNSATVGGVAAAMAVRLLGGGNVPKWVKLTPEVWDNGTAAGRAKIEANYARSRPPSYSARQQIKPWTTYTKKQLFDCKNVG